MGYTMQRGLAQSLYKYLPDSWIDFPVRGEERHNYIAKVDRWNSTPIEGINNKRLLRIVNNMITYFTKKCLSSGESSVKPTSGFGEGLTLENCNILTPKNNSDERGIIAKLDPLTFYCPKCHNVYQFNSKDKYERLNKCPKCHAELKQLRFVYYCECGWSSSRQRIVCPTCKTSDYTTWSGKKDDFAFYCTRCHKKIQMIQKCKDCGKALTPGMALESSQYYPKTIDLIDIIDEKLEDFIGGADDGAYLAIANWLGKISNEEFDNIVQNGYNSDPNTYQESFDKYYKMFIEANLDDNAAQIAAKASASSECGNSYVDIINDIKSELIISEDNCTRIAESILEYTKLFDIKSDTSLEDAKSIATRLNTDAHPELFSQIAAKRGIEKAHVFGEIPFVTCAYGYTRRETEPKEGVQLRAFKEETHGKKNIYAAKLKTEGVVFEFDRVKILKWLALNNMVDVEKLPPIDDSVAIKLWFINNIKLDKITPFDELNKELDPETYYTYDLIHTISHLLIRSASELCGLSKDSISEYIMPNVPAVLIYCQNSQGFNLGALLNVFEAYFDKWMENALKAGEKCIFDPICIDKYKACAGCVYLNEISCQHFNHDLDRSLVVGYVDKIHNKRYYGFWEE